MSARSEVILITGASSGFGLLAARALATAGHTVYASMRDTRGRNAPQVQALGDWARETRADIRPLELDVQSEASAEAAVRTMLDAHGQIDVLVHNAGHMVLGPTEAFTPAQLAAQYDVNVLGAHRLNRAALPHMRGRGEGLLVWVGSSSTRGGTPPWLGPYFAAKAAMDSLAVCYAGELARWGVETSIVVPGAYTSGTNHFLHSGRPADSATLKAYEQGPYAGFADTVGAGLASLAPADENPDDVARAIVEVVGAPRGRRPFRVHVNTEPDGAHVVAAVADRVRAEFLRRAGLSDLLQVTVSSVEGGA
jgi:NAD(P)-dependent dehydrogenase (short-subunit alcohol dehydrogenase family)